MRVISTFREWFPFCTYHFVLIFSRFISLFFSGNFKFMIRLNCYLKMHQLPRELYSDFMTFFNVFGLVYGLRFVPREWCQVRKRGAPPPPHSLLGLSLSKSEAQKAWLIFNFYPKGEVREEKDLREPRPQNRERERICHKRANIKIWITTLAFFDNTTRRETKKRIIQTAWATCIVGRGSTMVKSKWSMR